MMKVGIIVVLLILFIAIIFGLETLDNEPIKVLESISVNHQPSNKILLATGYWPPYVDKTQTGLGDRIVIAACEASELEIVIEFFPWERCLEMTSEGVAMATYPWKFTESRDLDFSFTEELFETETGMFYLDETFDDVSVEDVLKNEELTVGVLSNYYYLEYLEFANPDYSTSEVNAVEKLMNGRIDVLILEKYNVLALTEEFFPEYSDRLNFKVGFIAPVSMTMMVGDELVSPQVFIRDFNRGLEIIKSNGVYDTIIEEFMGEF